MLVPPHILLLFVLAVWGTFFFELSVDTLRAAAEFGGLDPWSSAAFDRQHVADLALRLGLLFGLPIAGFFTDRIGRYRLLLVGLLLAPTFSALGAISLSIFDFLPLRFLTGAALAALPVAVLTLQFECRKSFRKFLAPAVVLTLMLVLLTPRLPWPEIPWRPAMLMTALPALLVLFFRRFHDEPIAWKATVRDVPPENRGESFHRIFTARRRLLCGILLSLSLAAVVFGITRIGRDCLHRSIRFDSATRESQREARLEDAALLAILLRYPQLLDTKEVAEINLISAAEMFTPSPDDMTRCLFEGILILHEQKRPINREAAIDRALGCWNDRYGNGRQPEAIPSDEIERFWHEAENVLDQGEAVLAEKDILPSEIRGEMSGANLWEHRKTAMKTLWQEVRQRHRERIESERRELADFGLRFLAGGFFGLFPWLAGLSRFGLRKMCLDFGGACLLVSSGFLFFTPSPDVTEYAGLTLFVFILGFVAIPYAATLCVLIPARFPCGIRGMGTGLVLAAGTAVILPLPIVPLLLCLALGLIPLLPKRNLVALRERR